MKRAKLFHIIIASGFGSGFSPFAPGTVGALVAIIIWTVLFYVIPFNTLLIVTSLLIVLFTAAGIWSADKMESEWGKDPSKVVIDEMVGVWIALLAVPEGNIWYILFAFLLFRFFDIFKPLGIRKMEQLDGGIGVMADDILAGIYSFLLLMGLRWLIG
ncbi:phosphatidylglycerophosphatase A [uncultured Coprobacter sp.]|jgi:phosphatidylglycerophosphatase A|uniref:phosphatidylglycerophosphatase A family protein n=1 Tax=uncultured Coprobacter sp. TaxID=1720550 RepID=UPI0025E925E5|nr:phosphatidylglycerophosphatase A [uncultured Coprobacter sp.]